MKKTQGRPPMSDTQKKHSITCRVSFEAYNFLRSDECSNISFFVDNLLTAYLDAKKAQKTIDTNLIKT